MSFKKQLDHIPPELLSAKGLLYQDWKALTPCQRECSGRFAKSIQIEQEAYMTEHPEVLAMFKLYVASLASAAKRKMLLPDIALHFTRPTEEIIGEITNYLGVEGPSFVRPGKETFSYKDPNLEEDLKGIVNAHYPPKPWDVVPSPVETPDTLSSAFISLQTSSTTLPTPEPVPTPEPTMEEVLFNAVSNAIDKAIFMNVTEKALRYDIAYMELTKAVEEAMEVPVIEIKADIAELFFNAYKMFELIILEKLRKGVVMASYTNQEYADILIAYGRANCNAREARRIYQEWYPTRRLPNRHTFQNTYRRVAETGSVSSQERASGVRYNVSVDDNILEAFAEDGRKSIREVAEMIGVSPWKVWRVLQNDKQHAFHYTPVQAEELAWEKRMRKKLKHTLRLQKNFKGYETPPTPKSNVSSHESYRIPPQKPCQCHPQWRYNRYRKDRFGVYFPSTAETFDGNNLTVTPALSVEDLTTIAPTATPRTDPESITSKKSGSSNTL